MRRMFMVAALLAFASLAGCATVEFVPAAETAAARPGADGLRKLGDVSVCNTTWRVLMLPVASGDVDDPGACSCSWFSNSGTLEGQMKMLGDEAARRGAARVTDVSTLTTDEDFLLLILLREKIHTSASLWQ